MFLFLAVLLIAGWLFYMARKFYGRTDWNEPAEYSPDFHAMHKKTTQLQHIQEVLEEAHQEGKLSKKLIEEFNQYYESERAATEAQEKTWKNRPR